MSLNPKKCVFSTNQGKLLGHIVSRNGLTIDPERVDTILSLPLLSHKKGLQRFLGRINFIRSLILDLDSMVKPLTTILKKNLMFTWTKEMKASFEEIKKSIALAPTLVNPILIDILSFIMLGESQVYHLF